MWNEVAGAARDRALLVQMAVAEATGVGLMQLCASERGSPRSALARQMAMYLCRLVLAMTPAEVGQVFGRDRKTVCHALLRVEELREDYEFDRAMSLLEAGLSRFGRSA